jgi:site-specific recombinase XerD
MKEDPRLFAALLQAFFTQRLVQQKQASAHTIASYRDTFRLLLCFARKRLHKAPSQLAFDDVDAPFVAEFLNDLEKTRQISARSRNLRLTAIRSFFRYAGYETPSHCAQIQRVLAIPSKRYDRTQVRFLSRPEIDALLQAPDVTLWSGRRDQLLLLIAIQTGLRLSELTQLTQDNLVLDRPGSHIRCLGKGRKERCTPLTRQAAARLQDWLREPQVNACNVLFPSARGQRLSGDGVRYILAKHIATAAINCPSLNQKNVTPHMLRHTMAMELLQAGVDRSVIALWLGHESVETTQIYLEANLALKEKILLANPLPDGPQNGRYRPDDDLLAFLSGL